MLAVLSRRGGAVLVGRDLYKEAHPQYDALMRENDLTSGVRARPDVLRWEAEVEAHVRLNRFDAVLEAPIADLAEAIATVRVWRAAAEGCPVTDLWQRESGWPGSHPRFPLGRH
ncbi:zeta toxin family protein [Streptomyces sp. CA-243310]|uniref:zeta toxin family protein n=1 Tax=Streptomyces sp. CA-243310 TaxID=3240056 RepID=UPI003D8DD72F